MKWWPFSKRAAQPYTDQLVNALLARASADTGTVLQTAALEACSILYAAGFIAARVDAAENIKRLLKPELLALIARDMIRKGENLHLIEVAEGALRLLPAGTWDIRGGHDPATWSVRLDLFGPAGSVSRFVSHEATLHCRYSINPARPWRGVGPLGWADSTGTLAGRLEAMLANEAGAPSAQLVPVPADGGDGSREDPLAQLKYDLAEAKGKALLIETTAAGWGQGMGQAPRKDWVQSRIGADWPDVLRSTREDIQDAVYSACNVPAVLLSKRAEGTSQREAYRRFTLLGLKPLAVLIEAELEAKLNAPVRISFDPLMSSDLAGKARAIKGMVDAGIALEKALEIAGIE